MSSQMQQQKKRTALIMAGGTGGHVFPALAVAKILLARGWHVEWLGTDSGIEARVVPANNITLNVISAVGLRGKGVAKLLMAPPQLLRALWQACRVFYRLRPGVVLGMGGFASGPGGLCAFLLLAPLVIHEQNAVAGTTNRMLAYLATRVLSAFPGVFVNAVFSQAEAIGNPVREDIAALAFEKRSVTSANEPLKLLVLGGSQGARALNLLLPQALALLPAAQRPQVFHQAGANQLSDTRAEYTRCGVIAQVEPFVEDMAQRYRWADVAVCRSGAMTVSELACAALPSLLVPFPFAIDDHQTANAHWLADAGGADMLQQYELTAEKLAGWLQKLTVDRQALHAMTEKLRQLANPAAATRVADICEEVSRD